MQKRYEETGYQKYLTPKEWAKINWWLNIKCKSPPSRLMVYVMAYLGLRCGEVIRLKRENFNSDFSILRYQPLKKRKLKIHTRAVPKVLQEMLVSYNQKYHRRYREGHLFFPYMSGSKNVHIQRSTVHHLFKKMRRETGITEVYYIRKDGNKLHRLSAHTMRHFFAANASKVTGNNYRKVQHMLCHSKIETTMKYVIPFLTIMEEKNDADKIAELMG